MRTLRAGGSHATAESVTDLPLSAGVRNYARTAWTSMPQPGNGPVRLTITSRWNGRVAQGGTGHGGNAHFDRIAQVPGVGNALVLHQHRTSATEARPGEHNGAHTFSFSEPVRGLSFVVADVDQQPSDFADRVEVTAGAGSFETTHFSEGGRRLVRFRHVGEEMTALTVRVTNPLHFLDPAHGFEQTVWIGGFSFSYSARG